MAALAAPEAEADAYYGHGYGLAHGAALVGPSGLSAAWPAVRGYGVQSTCYGCRGHVGYGKRSADADAYYGYGHGLAYGLHAPSAYSVRQIHPSGSSYQSVNRLHGLGHYYGKREAEADAEADAEAYYGYGHGLTYGRGLAYGHGLTTYAHAPVATIAHSVAPVATVAHAVAPVATVAYAAAPVATYSHGLSHGLGHHAISSNVYSGHTGNTYVTGLPGHSYAAVSRLHKREAEAEAEAEPEADAYYGSYGHRLGYAGYGHGYGHGYGRGYAGLGYSHGGYAGHGYGHGYGYGYYG